MTQPVPDVATLFARDPEKMSEADIEAIITVMREKRHIFNQAPIDKKAPKLTAKEEKVSKELNNLTLDLKL